MLVWIKLFWDICRLRKGPQDVPYSPALLWLLLILNIGSDPLILQLWRPEVEFGIVFIAALTHLSVSLLVLVFIMIFMSLANRINQTLNSLLGAGLILNLISLPFLLVYAENSTIAAFSALALLMIYIWSIVITIHIFKQSLTINYIMASVLTIGFIILGNEIINLFLPVEPPTETTIELKAE